MKTLNLKIDDNFFPQFKALVDGYVNEHKIEIIKDENFDYENNYPQSVVLSSVEEVKKRVLESEHRIEKGEFHTQEDYEILMNKFFSEELNCLEFGSMSCEMIGALLLKEFKLVRVEVNEDNENGCLVYSYED